MTISNSLRQSLGNGFWFNNNSDTFRPSISLTDKFLVAGNIGGFFFIPTICAKDIAITLRVTGDEARGGIVTQLHQPKTDTKKTADSVISRLFHFDDYYRHNNFFCIDTTKGYKYYGGRGLILDNDCTPLMVCGYEVVLRSFSLDNPTYEYISPICLISPSVFEREDMVSKTIVKKIIPYLSSNPIVINNDINNERCQENRVKVVITHEINKIIHGITPPLETDVDDAIYNLLHRSLREVRR